MAPRPSSTSAISRSTTCCSSWTIPSGCAALDYDRRHATELLRTARVLLDHDLDRRAAAGVLHLHPNTVQQRLRRLESLLGLRLSRPRDLLQLTAALSVARIAGLG